MESVEIVGRKYAICKENINSYSSLLTLTCLINKMIPCIYLFEAVTKTKEYLEC